MLPSTGKLSSSALKRSSDQSKSSASPAPRSKPSLKPSHPTHATVSSSPLFGEPSKSASIPRLLPIKTASLEPKYREKQTTHKPSPKPSSTAKPTSNANTSSESRRLTDTEKQEDRYYRQRLREILTKKLRDDPDLEEKLRPRLSPKVFEHIQSLRSRPSTAPTMARNVKQPFAALMQNLGALSSSSSSNSNDSFSGNSNSARSSATGSFTGSTTSSIASAAFAPLLKKYGSPGLLPTPSMSLSPNIKSIGSNTTGLKAKTGVWKRLGDIPGKIGLGGSNLSSPRQKVESPVSPSNGFNHFRQQWEASRKQEKDSKAAKVVVNQVQKIQVDNINEIVSVSLPLNDKDKKENRGTEKILRAGSGGSGSGYMEKTRPSLVKEDFGEGSDNAVHRITVVKDSPKKVLRDPLAKSSVLPSKPIKRLAQRTTPSRGGSGHGRMPNSWKLASQQAGKDKPQSQRFNYFDNGNFQFSSTLPNLVMEGKSSPTKFTSPLELQYPFPHSLTPQLKMFAWDSQRQAAGHFGWFNKTNSMLNPILPGIPRIPKPNDVVESPKIIGSSPSTKDSTGCLEVSISGASTPAKRVVDTITWETPFSLRCISNVNNAMDGQSMIDDIDTSDDDEGVY